MKILVTGGAGYLGSILCRRLLEEGHEVFCLDNLSFGLDPIMELMKEEKFKLINGDIKDMNIVSNTLSKGMDIVIHLASIVGKPAAEVNPFLTIETNYLATKNLAELCKLYKIKKFIFASTCSVYGDQPESVITETSPTKPIELYAEYKLRSEKAIFDIIPDALILRMGTLFGLSPRMRYDLAINRFIAQSIQDKKITVFGGAQFRPFLHVSDAADGYVFAIKNDLKGLYNLSWENWTILDVGTLISGKMKSELTVSRDIVDLRNYKVDSSKFHGLGYRPTRTIEMAMDEIEKVFQREHKDYTNPKFDNQGTLFRSEEVRKKVYTQGLVWR